jgi:outer membrane protein assembly factor BamB
LAAIAACGISPAVLENDLGILGTRPGYGPPTVSAVPNLTAAGPLLWMPGLNQGWDPQGLAAVDGSLLVSAYRSDRLGVNRGPCRVFRIDPVSGRENGHFNLPPVCGHAGGLAYAGDGTLYVADTHTLFEVDLDRAVGNRAPAFRIFPLGPGLKGALAASGQGEIWIGTYEEDRPGRIFRYDRRVLKALPDGAMLTRELAAAELTIPSYAQGAAVSSGRLWIARSEIAWGSLEKLDLASGRVVERYPAPGGIEGVAFDDTGGLWAVSEAGARRLPGHYPFFPVIFRLDLNRMTPAAAGS